MTPDFERFLVAVVDATAFRSFTDICKRSFALVLTAGVVVTIPLFWKHYWVRFTRPKAYALAVALDPEMVEREEEEIGDIAMERMDLVLRKLGMIEARE